MINPQPFHRTGYLKTFYKTGIIIPIDQQKEQDMKYKGNCWSKPGHHRMKVSC